MVLNVDHNLITLAYLDGRAGHHAIDHGYATLQSIAQHAVRARAIADIEGTIEASLREGLIPFDHKCIMTLHRGRIYLTVAHTWMLAIPFCGPYVFRNLNVIQFLHTRRGQWSTDLTAAVPLNAP